MIAVLEYRSVRVCYSGSRGASPAIDDVSFSLAKGERVALLGLNGSGKTTLLMAAVGLVRFDGEVAVCGLRQDRHTIAEIRSKVGFLFNVPEDQLLFPRVLDDVTFGLTRRGMHHSDAAIRARAMLAALGIEDLADAVAYELSHGQKQRVALAGALVTEPEVLLLDEPSSGLDPLAKRQLARHLCHLPSAALIATHDLAFAKRVCSRYVLIANGRLQEQGSDFDCVERHWECHACDEG